MFKKLLFLLGFILMLPVAQDTALAESGLIGWWKLDEGNGTIAEDSSGKSVGGTLFGEPEWDQDGVHGGSLLFDGIDDYVFIDGSFRLPVYTMTLWFRVDGGSGQRDILSAYAPGVQHGILLEVEADGTLRYLHRYPLGSTQDHDLNLYTATAYNDAVWHHVAIVKSTVEMKLYINEQQVCSLPNSSQFDAADVFGVALGNLDNERGLDRLFLGAIDDFRIYNYALNKDEVAAVYAGETIDVEISIDPDQMLEKAYEDIRELDSWRTNHIVRQEHANKIATILLNIAKAKEAKGLLPEQVLDHYYELIAQFPGVPQAIDALCRVIVLDEKNGLAYATDFLEKCADPSKITALYAKLIKCCLAKSDFSNAEKYVKFFISKYASDQNGLKMMAQLKSNFRRVRERQQFDKIIEGNLVEDPNSAIWCAAFRQRTMTLSETEDPGQLVKMAESVRGRFPKTRLATCATAVLADNHYRQGNYVLALKVFKPGLFAEHRSESEIIEDIDNTVAIYNANTLQVQGIDLGKLYQALAQHCHRLGLIRVAVHCYK